MTNKLVAQIVIILGCANLMSIIWYALIVPDVSDSGIIAAIVFTCFIIFCGILAASERDK